MPRDRFDLSANALAASARKVQNFAHLQTWTSLVLRVVLPHHALVCGQLVRHSGGWTVLQQCNVDMPPAYLAPLERPGSNLGSPLLARFLQTPELPHFFDVQRDVAWARTHPDWYGHYLRAGWRNTFLMGYTAGEGDKQVLTAAAFYNVAPALERNAHDVQHAVMPSLHAALCCVYEVSQASKASHEHDLTCAEKAIAMWLTRGKSTKEIAKELGKSDHTVKHQIDGMMRKFGVSRRTELVSHLGAL